MCGRFVMIDSEEKVMRSFEIQQSELVLEPRYNIFPAQDIPVIVQQNGLRSLEMYQWGLIPFWVKEPNPMINARAETASEKPSFRQAFRKKRCLIPTSGFYEWVKEDGLKQPYFIHSNTTLCLILVLVLTFLNYCSCVHYQTWSPRRDYLISTGTVRLKNDFSSWRLSVFGEPLMGYSNCPPDLKHNFVFEEVYGRCLITWKRGS